MHHSIIFNMKLTIKDLRQCTFQIEVDEKKTVKEFKDIIENVKGPLYAANRQTLIYAGKILENSSTLNTLNLDEKHFLVLMLRPPVSKNDKLEVADQSAASGVLNTENSLTYPEPIANLIEMGYDREDVLNALQASSNNPERAVEYLINGLPDDHLNNMDTQLPSNRLAFLRQSPEFRQMQQLVFENPIALRGCIDQLSRTNPQLFQIISENQQDFIDLLNEFHPTEDNVLFENNTADITITDAERGTIERLKALGFSEHLVIQAYFACDKDENLTAEFLFSQVD